MDGEMQSQGIADSNMRERKQEVVRSEVLVARQSARGYEWSQSLNLNDEGLFLVSELFIYNVGRGKYKHMPFHKGSRTFIVIMEWLKER